MAEKSIIRRVEFHSIRSIDKIRQEFGAVDEESQWIILLGNNGSGKTAFLKATTLALVPLDVAQTVVHNAKPPVSYVRLGRTFGEISVTCGGETYGVKVRPRGKIDDQNNTIFENPLKKTRKWWPFVAAYGSQRGSALGKGVYRSHEERPQDTIQTLFDESSDLVNAEDWLKALDYRAKSTNSPEDMNMLDFAKKSLVTLLPDVSNVEVSPDGVLLTGADGTLPLAASSDGYLTTIGWAIDLLVRRTQHHLKDPESHSTPLDLEKMDGIVLIDEIDLHLHPIWQAQVIDLIRKVFPKMTFIVTTHSPLTVLNARPGELFLLVRDEDDNSVKLVQRDIRPGMTSDQILTGQWFDMSSTVDSDTLNKLESYREIMREGIDPEAPERIALELELSKRLGGVQGNSVERMAFSVASEIIDKDIRELTPAEREQARAKILELTRRRIGEE